MGKSLPRLRWALGCLAICLIYAAPAAATTLPLGQTAPGGTPVNVCADCTLLQQATGALSPQYTVPTAGTITSWSMQGAPSPLDCSVTQCVAKLRVLRPDGLGHYLVAAESVQQAIAAGQLDTFTSSIPVQAGDVLGVEATQVPLEFAGTGSDVVGTVSGLPLLGSLISGLGLDPSKLLNLSVTVDVGGDASTPPPTGGSTTTTTGSGGTQDRARFAGVKLSRRTLKVGRSGRVRVPVSCPRSASGSCHGSLTLVSVHAVSAARKRLKLASAKFSVPAGRTRSVVLKISRSGRKALAKHRRLSARLTAAARDGSGVLAYASRTVMVTQPKSARTTR